MDGNVEAGRRPPRPGPDALYGENPTPPQLENGPGWDADPLLVAGSAAYVEGEYLYQDYVYDDHGADTRSLLSLAPSGAEGIWGPFAQPTGDLHYPNDPERYGYNAADLLEFRARPTEDGVAYRVTLNTMLESDAAAVAIGIDTTAGDPGPDHRTDWGYGLGELGAPADHVLVTWGTGAELDGEPLDDDRVSVDLERNQLEVEVPLAPAGETWRHYLAVGLWNPEWRSFKAVAVEPTENVPGGRGRQEDVPPVFNVGFRFDEPCEWDRGDLVTGALDVLTGHAPSSIGEGNWREHGQAMALAARDISGFYADVAFARLESGETDHSGVPETGYLNFLYPSRYDFGEGVDPVENVLRGTIQPYAAYVPETYEGDPVPLTVLLHSLGNCYNQYAVYTPGLLSSLAETTGGIVLIPQSRGPGRWYQREGEIDVFEAWRDLESRYEIDRDRVSVAGYSMGGFGTLMLAGQYPDLFARGFSVVGPPTEDPIEGATAGLCSAPDLLTGTLLGGQNGGWLLSIFNENPESALHVTDNLRHVPLLVWNGAADVLVPVQGPLSFARYLRRHGYRHEIDVFPVDTHLSFAIRDKWHRGPEFLASGRVERMPDRVTYRHVPELDHPDVDLIHDGAYWVHDVHTRGCQSGRIDVTSYARGYVEPERRRYRRVGRRPRQHYAKGVEWVTPATDGSGDPEGRNAIGVRMDCVEHATLYVEEVGIRPDEPLTVRVASDGPATLTLVGSFGAYELAVEGGDHTVRVDSIAAGAVTD
ncbi:S9 family peptidase [Salinirubellus salinus]|uniref:S9 family peptidase n=1 Tax=Salinirubellus salinus TaxID=1364945 RepID=A0A9E7UAY4_9EURY|nr:S9 family peptidase [Salinirubellus salinus]UWM54274.1 S9 family peptidase [Salinirubellus salinus]